MNYPIRCECGKEQRVPGSMAGSILNCPCGRQIEVPALSKLRSLAGQRVLSPEVRLEQMLQLAMLPSEKQCVICGAETKNVAHFWAICERVQVESPPSGKVLWLMVPLTIFLGICSAAFALFYILNRSQGERQHGNDVRLRLPLRICEQCAPKLKNPSELEKSVWSVPDYRELLDKYPNLELGLDAQKKGVNLNRRLE